MLKKKLTRRKRLDFAFAAERLDEIRDLETWILLRCHEN
jgi:hypothetical protein